MLHTTWSLFVPRAWYTSARSRRMKVKTSCMHEFIIAFYRIPVPVHTSSLNWIPCEPFWQALKKKRKKETEQCTFYVYLNLCPFRHIICSFRITYSYWVTSLVCMVMDRHPIRVPSSLMSSVPGIVYSTTMTLTRIKQKEVFAFTYCTSVVSLPFAHWRKEVFEQKCEKLLFPGYIM